MSIRLLSAFVDSSLLVWVVMAAVMALVWRFQKRHTDASIVDAGWAAGMGLAAIVHGCVASSLGFAAFARCVLVALAGALWAFRLASFLYTNRVVGKPEDGRYRELRARWGTNAQFNFFVFFQFQAFLVVLMSTPFFFAASNPARHDGRYFGLGVLDALGVAVWLIAIAGEAIADRQLAAYRADPAHRGHTCRQGLWRYSRHPNYFFEWLHWWAYVALAIGSPLGWLTLLGPALMLLFLYKVTGIPYTEKQALRCRGDDYRAYQHSTSAFIPWFPKRA